MEKPVAPERADRRRALILLAALVLLLAANLRPSYSVTVAGAQLPGCYGLRQTERCAALARETAEEILGREPLLPEPELHLRLSLGGADGDDARLTDALLRATPGVAVAEEVRVNGIRLGTVADGQTLVRALERSIRGQMPNAAVVGNLSGELQIQTVYSRSGQETNYDDMILLITGMAPVVYVDANGKLA